MTAFIVVLVLLIVAGVAHLAYVSSGSAPTTKTESPPTETELLQARLDLLRIERRVDVTLAREEALREAERTKQAIADALENER